MRDLALHFVLLNISYVYKHRSFFKPNLKGIANSTWPQIGKLCLYFCSYLKKSSLKKKTISLSCRHFTCSAFLGKYCFCTGLFQYKMYCGGCVVIYWCVLAASWILSWLWCYRGETARQECPFKSRPYHPPQNMPIILMVMRIMLDLF